MANTSSSASAPALAGKRIFALLCGLIAGGALGAIGGMIWFSVYGFALGGLCGALIGAVAPPRIGRAMLLSYILIGIFSFLGFLRWFSSGQFKAWLESPIGSGPAGMNESFLAWPLSIFSALAAAAITAIAMSRPWQKPTQRQLSWVGVAAAILPLLLPGIGASWLLAGEREGQADRQAHEDQMDEQRRSQAQSLEREKTRLSAAAQRLNGALGELQYPAAAPAVLVADGMSFTCETSDPLANVVAYYERLLGHPFRVRPANDGGSSRFYNDSIHLTDAREIYVYIEPPTASLAATRITIAPL